jgi:hypothetical protein
VRLLTGLIDKNCEGCRTGCLSESAFATPHVIGT